MRARIYADLIKRRVINPKTGMAYTIDDVPPKYRSAVEDLL